MISPAIITDLDARQTGVVFELTSEGKFIKANGYIVDTSLFRGEELARWKDVDADRKEVIVNAILVALGYNTTPEVSGEPSPIVAEVTTVVQEPAVETPEAVVEEIAFSEAVMDNGDEGLDLPDETPTTVVVEEVVVATNETEAVMQEPAKKSSKKK